MKVHLHHGILSVLSTTQRCCNKHVRHLVLIWILHLKIYQTKIKKIILYGAGDREFHFKFKSDFGGLKDIDTTFEGVIPNVERRYRETNSDFTRDVMRQYMTSLTCQTC